MGQLGDILHDRRTTLGISIEAAEEATRIRGRLLAALEAGDYSRLPNPGYVRGYVSSYAKFLELDPVPLLAMYRAETGAGRYHDINLVDDVDMAPRGQQHAVPWKAGLVVVAVIAVIAGVVWLGAKIRAPELPPVLPAGATTATVSTVSMSNVKITVAAGAACDITATLDGKQMPMRNLTGGQTAVYDFRDSAAFLLGTPAAVTVVQDGVKQNVPIKAPAKIELSGKSAQ